MSVLLPPWSGRTRSRNMGTVVHTNDCHGQGQGQRFTDPAAPPEALSAGPPLNSQLRVEGQGGASAQRQAHGLPADAGQGVAGDPGSSRSLPIPPAPPQATRPQRHAHRSTTVPPEGLAGSGRASGLDAGGAAPHNPRLPVPDAPRHHPHPGYRVTREPPGALAEPKAGASAGRSKRRRVRAVSARLETVQKVITNCCTCRMPHVHAASTGRTRCAKLPDKRRSVSLAPMRIEEPGAALCWPGWAGAGRC